MKALLFIVVLFVIATVSSLAVFCQQNQSSSRCSLDGSQVHPMYEVIIIQKDNTTKKFACVLSARIWFDENSESISSILLTDEPTGQKIKANSAFFVVSDVITTPYTGNKIHVFADSSKAISHAKKFNGKLIENPFQAQKMDAVLLVEHGIDHTNSGDFLFPSSQNPLSLPTPTALIMGKNYFFYNQKYHSRLSVGYLTPPEKPPRSLI